MDAGHAWLAHIRTRSSGAAFGARVRTKDDPEYLTLKLHEQRTRDTLERIAGPYSLSDEVVRGLRGFDARRMVLRFDPNSPADTEVLDTAQPAPSNWQEASELGNTPENGNETITEDAAEQRATEQPLNRSPGRKSDERRQIGGAVKENPFEDQAVVTKIRADLARIKAELLQWFAEPPAEGSLDDQLVETLVRRLDAYACGWLSVVDSTPRIADYLNRLRQVGEILIRDQRKHGLLSNPYSEDRLRQIAESAGSVIQLKFTGRPEVYEAALKAEIERTRSELRSKALEDLHRRSSILSRIETRFEARYSHWEAEAIEQVQSQSRTDDSEDQASARVSSGEGPMVEQVEGSSSAPPMEDVVQQRATEQLLNSSTENKGDERRRLIDAFLGECNEVSTVLIVRAHIWRLVGHRHARQFEYWQAGNDRLVGTTRGATKQDDQNFRRVLSMRPEEFIAQLQQSELISAKS